MKPLTLGLLFASTALSPLQAQDLEEISVALGWLRNGQYSALMVADTQGFFEEEGLKVTFIDGGPGKNPVPIVGVGQAEFGVFGASSIIFARLAQSPVNIKAIGVMSQQRPYAYITITDPDAPDPVPADLVGATVGMQSDGQPYLDALAAKNGIDPASVEVQVVLATPEPLLLGQIDYFTGMMHNQTYQIDQEIAKAAEGSPLHGKVWKALSFNDYGVPFYHDAIFTSDALIEENPDLIRRFLAAVAKGLEFAVENPDQTVADVKGYPEQVEDEAKLAWRMPIQAGFAISADTAEHGYLWMEPSIWEENMAFYENAGEIDRIIPVEEVMTNEFNPGLKSRDPE